ncbi:MAG: hypothetical protein ABIF09_05655, partial [Gemmatimonadota bacterium]
MERLLPLLDSPKWEGTISGRSDYLRTPFPKRSLGCPLPVRLSVLFMILDFLINTSYILFSIQYHHYEVVGSQKRPTMKQVEKMNRLRTNLLK